MKTWLVLILLGGTVLFATRAHALGRNIALGKAVTVSKDNLLRPANKANDDVVTSTFNGGSIAEAQVIVSSDTTLGNRNISWIQIDLGSERAIQSVEVFNTTEVCGGTNGACAMDGISIVGSLVPPVDKDATFPRPGVTAHPSSIANGAGTGGSKIFPFNRPMRYFRLQSNNGRVLDVAEIRVFLQDNAAKNRVGILSSTAAGAVAARALDDNTNQTSSGSSIAQTNVEVGAYFEVDLGSTMAIRKISITPRNDGYTLPSNVKLLLNRIPFPPSRDMGDFIDYFDQMIDVPVSSGRIDLEVYGNVRYVRVMLDTLTNPAPGALALAEVEVWPLGMGNQNAFARQSSTNGTNTADRAVDGKTNGDLSRNSVSRTNSQANAWWQVDLGNVRTIDTVNLWNRVDGVATCDQACLNRLASFYIFFSQNYEFKDTDTIASLKATSGVTFIDNSLNATGARLQSFYAKKDARFVRIMLNKTDVLNIAEVEFVSLDSIVTGPQNGKLYNIGTSDATKTFTFTGFVPSPGTKVEIYTLNNAVQDPDILSNWGLVATANIASNAASQLTAVSAAPMYAFSVTPSPSNPFNATKWPQGALGRVRALFVDKYGTKKAMRTVDEDGLPSFYWPQANFISTVPTPTALSQPPGQPIPIPPSAADLAAAPRYLTAVADLGLNAADQLAETNAYYATQGVGPSLDTLTKFRNVYFVNPSEAEVTARYYQKVDLGIGREMHCVETTNFDVACYVSNYADALNGRTKFGDAANSLARTVENPHTTLPFATVAMVWRKNPPAGQDPIVFVVYGSDGNLAAAAAKLDNKEANTFIPGNCLVCHGAANYDVTSHSAYPTGAGPRPSFLQFDLSSYDFPTSGPFTRVAQEEAFRELNVLVSRTDLPVTLAALIEGWYFNRSDQNQEFVPDGWKLAPQLYKKVVRSAACRTCHASNEALPWSTQDQFLLNGMSIVQEVCQYHRMPNSEQALNFAWTNSSRAHLLGAFGKFSSANMGEACGPKTTP